MTKLITSIAAEDKSHTTAKGLLEDYGIHASFSHFARGFGRSSPLEARGLGQQTEKVIMSVLVPNNRANEIFSYIYRRCGADLPHGGIVYITAVRKPVVSPLVEIKEATENDNE